VRIPLPYWAIEVRQGEPFLANTCWTYFLKAIAWARKYGIRINVDLHTVPGSQNGWNHSGKFGTIGWLHGPMGVANAQRALDYIRILAEFVSQPQYRDVVAMFGIINEPFGPTIGQNNIERLCVSYSSCLGDHVC
jgi:glucan 1,3-beta-glucosidase